MRLGPDRDADPEIGNGHLGLRKAIELAPQAKVQRCAWHKGQNLFEHCPAHAQAELRRDYPGSSTPETAWPRLPHRLRESWRKAPFRKSGFRDLKPFSGSYES